MTPNQELLMQDMMQLGLVVNGKSLLAIARPKTAQKAHEIRANGEKPLKTLAAYL